MADRSAPARLGTSRAKANPTQDNNQARGHNGERIGRPLAPARGHNRGRVRKPPGPARDTDKQIVVRDRRKPNQYTTDNVIAREWLPILRIGDAFFFYSVYLSMANRETESSWGSLRTQAEYLQCGVDLIVRGNKLLEICELVHVETGNHQTSNEYYILDPPSLTPELASRIHQRLDEIAEQEQSKNWQSWVKQVRKALEQHRSLPDIWAERRTKRGGRPVKTLRAEHSQPADKGLADKGLADKDLADKSLADKSLADKGGIAAGEDRNGERETQPGYRHNGQTEDKGACESQAGCVWPTTRVGVSHMQGGCDSHAEQEQLTDKHEQDSKEGGVFPLAQELCQRLGIEKSVLDLLKQRYAAERILRQLEWLPYRNPRDAAAMLVSAVQGDWEMPVRYDGDAHAAVPAAVDEAAYRTTLMPATSGSTDLQDAGPDRYLIEGTGLDARAVWEQLLAELRLQMTRATFDTWLGGAEVIDVTDDVVSVSVRDTYAAEWLQSRWHASLERTLCGIAGRTLAVRFVAPETEG